MFVADGSGMPRVLQSAKGFRFIQSSRSFIWERRLTVRSLATFTFIALLVGTIAAQTSMNTTAGYRHFDGHSWLMSKVRDKAGNLYLCYNDQLKPPQRDIAIARSTDGGKTWNMKWQTGFAALTSTAFGNLAPVMAIDDQENLHLAWCHVSSSNDSSWTTSYCRWNATSKSWSKEVTLSTPNKRQRFNCIAIDSKNTVWILRAQGTWESVLMRSNKPYASDDTFVNSTPLPTSEKIQHQHMVLDSLDRIHISYYSYTKRNSTYHLWIDPNATSPSWSSAFCFGTANGIGELISSMAADLAGNVYSVYGVEVPGTTTGPDPYLALRKWDGSTQKWTNELKFYTTKRSQLSEGGKVNSGDFIAGACDETTGEFYFVYRNFDSGEFLLARWHDGDPAPTTYAKLMTTGSLPPNALNYFAYPQIRGTVFPYFNRTSVGLDLTYTVGHEAATTPKYTLYYDAFPVGSLGSTGQPKIGSTYQLDLSAVMDPGMAYATAISLTGLTPGIPIGRRIIPLTPDLWFYITVGNTIPALFQNFHGTLNTSGIGQAKFNIPNVPALAGIKVYSAFITYPGATGLKTLSNPFTFTIVK